MREPWGAAQGSRIKPLW